jgi:hypothetical protein
MVNVRLSRRTFYSQDNTSCKNNASMKI